MSTTSLTNRQGSARCCSLWQWRKVTAVGVAAMTVPALSGCISIEAPDRPIVIELNINITQEVIYRLAQDAGNTIDENADIF